MNATRETQTHGEQIADVFWRAHKAYYAHTFTLVTPEYSIAN